MYFTSHILIVRLIFCFMFDKTGARISRTRCLILLVPYLVGVCSGRTNSNVFFSEKMLETCIIAIRPPRSQLLCILSIIHNLNSSLRVPNADTAWREPANPLQLLPFYHLCFRSPSLVPRPRFSQQRMDYITSRI